MKPSKVEKQKEKFVIYLKHNGNMILPKESIIKLAALEETLRSCIEI
ncbi:MAG: hypothetical protein IPL26_24065 [Leptospiraceae bacterium]|nr:hypothetical protein [Leptospiraceae bacterium]